MVEKWKKMVNVKPAFEMLEMILDDSGYRKMLEDDREFERIENLKELINDMQNFTIDYPESTLDEYLQLVSLYGEKEQETKEEYVSLMTIHAAKGLEFDCVFVVGMSDGIFPSERSIAESIKGVEEERRLAYVAYTRAKKMLYLTESSGFSYVLSKARVTSRFIDEIAEDNIVHVNKKKDISTVSYIDDVADNNEEVKIVSKKIESKSFKKGDKVEHAMFGLGVVTKVDGNFLNVAFKAPYGIKKIVKNHPSIKKV